MKIILYILLILVFIFIGYSISVSPSYESLDITGALNKAKSILKPNQEIVTFESKNPFNFYDIFNRIDEISDQKVFGILTKPDSIGVFPLIIGVAGSSGWGEHHYGYLKRYLEMGFAVFSLHSFKSRDVESTIGEQLSVTIPMVIHDAFMALNKLSNDKSVFFRDDLLENLTLPQIINNLGNPDYERKQGTILTFQYRQKECVVDFFFKDNSDRLIFYDMRKRDYLGKFSKKLCILSLNLRRIY